MKKTGRYLTEIDIEKLSIIKGDLDSYIKIMKSIPLIGESVSISSTIDISGMGIEMKWMTVDEILDECLNCYPGKIVIEHGYLPIGMCLEGTGDYYYLNIKNGTVCRIYHDSGMTIEEIGIDLVSESLKEFVAN